MRRKLVLLGAVAMSVSLAACGSSGGSGGSSSGNKSIAFIPGVTGNAFYVSMECGIRSEAKKAGYSVNVQGPSAFDPAQQIPVLNAVIATKPAAILIAPTDAKAMIGPIRRAMEAGIKVVLVDTTLADTKGVVTDISTDNVAAGEAAGKALSGLVGGKGSVLAIPFQPGSSTSDQRTEGFDKGVAETPSLNLLTPQFSNFQASKAASIVTSTLAAHPDLSGIFATNDTTAEGAATGLRNADAIGKVKMVGFDASSVQIGQLKQGIVQALIAQEPEKIGVMGVDAAAKALDGKKVETKVTTGTVTITQDNLNSSQSQAAIYKDKC